MISFTMPDIAIAIVVGGFLIRGCVRGFFRETFSVVALGIAVLLTMQFSDLALSYASYFLGEADWLDSLTKPMLFFGSWVLAALFFRMMFGVLSIATPEWFSRLGGGIIGCAKGAFFVGLILAGMEAYAPGYPIDSGGTDKILPYMRQVSAYIQKFDLVDIEENLNAVKENLGAVKEKFEDGAGGASGEREARELKR